MTYHAVEETAEDGLEICDIESAILNGKIIKKEKGGPRGIKYTIKGLDTDLVATSIGVVGRLKETGVLGMIGP